MKKLLLISATMVWGQLADGAAGPSLLSKKERKKLADMRSSIDRREISAGELKKIASGKRPSLSEAVCRELFMKILVCEDWPEGEQLAQNFIVNGYITDFSKRSYLWFAVKHGHPEIAELLIDKGAPVNIHDHEGITPLMVAAEKGYAAAVRKMIKKRARVDAADMGGITALMEAVRNNHEEVAQLLLDAGANINSVTKGGFAPLRLAVTRHHVALARLLIARGANVGDCSKPAFDCSLLAEAIAEYVSMPSRGLGMVQLLLDSGATLARWRCNKPSNWPAEVYELLEAEEEKILRLEAQRQQWAVAREVEMPLDDMEEEPLGASVSTLLVSSDLTSSLSDE